MPSFEQSPPGLEPPTVPDHVLLPVADLEAGAEELRRAFGLAALAGGRHPGVGTANMIVPLGRQYLELIAVAEPAEITGPGLGQAVQAAAAAGRRFVAWALRTQDLDALRAKLLDAGWTLPELTEGARRRPDGSLLRWRTQDIAPRGEATALPFAIQWDVPEGSHPGEAQAAHPGGASGLRRVVVGARDPGRVGAQLELLVGRTDLVEVRPAERDGILELVLDAPGGELTLR
jgi:hypothetical protein